MSTRILKRKLHAHPRSADPANALYGYGYRPDWPSILCVSHDENDGSGLFVVLDRPCALSAGTLPMIVPDDGQGGAGGLAILSADLVLPDKLRLSMDGAVPHGAPWRWTGSNATLHDPTTGYGPNAGAGACFDFPGPYVPPPPPSVISTNYSGSSCTLTFDRDVTLVEGTPTPDDAILFDGTVATYAYQADARTLSFGLTVSLNPGSTWQITRQPGWVITQVVWPESGEF